MGTTLKDPVAKRLVESAAAAEAEQLKLEERRVAEAAEEQAKRVAAAQSRAPVTVNAVLFERVAAEYRAFRATLRAEDAEDLDS